MSESKGFCGTGLSRDTVAIDTNRILDSCRDKDCYEDVRVYLSDSGQEIIERTGSVRVKCADIISCQVSVEPVQFSRGFYTVHIVFYIRLTLEACISPGRTQEFYGLSAIEKKVILFGSEGNVNIYKSNGCGDFCSNHKFGAKAENNLPVGVVEVVPPVVLGVKVSESKKCCSCCCCIEDMPDEVVSSFYDRFTDGEGNRYLTVSLGFFSVVRIERPAQYLISATEYCVPRKECIQTEEDDPCSLFKSMDFPTTEFCPPSLSELSSQYGDGDSRCGCRNNKRND